MQDLPPVLSPEEAAELLDCETLTVETALRERRLPGIKYGRGWRIPREALLTSLNQQAMDHLSRPKTEALAITAIPMSKPSKKSLPVLPKLSGHAA